MTAFSRLAAAVVVLSSVLVAVPAGAASTGLEAGSQYHNHQSVPRHDAIAKNRKVRRAKKRADGSKTRVCNRSSAAPATAPTPPAAPPAVDGTTTATTSTTEAVAADPTTSSTTAAAVSSTPRPPIGGSKLGGSFNDGSSANLGMFFETGKFSWYYTWSSWPVDAAPPPPIVDHVPMLWGHKAVDDFNRNFDPAKHQWILTFNEPDQPDQSNMSPGDAVALWYAEVAPKNAKKVTPACTGGDRGFNWMKEFLAACSGCQIDAMAIHYYGKSADDFIAYVEKTHNAFGLPIWVTELACEQFGGSHCTDEEAYAFMHKAVDYMNGAGFIERYTYFGMLKDMYNVGAGNRIMDPSGQAITPFGYDLINRS